MCARAMELAPGDAQAYRTAAQLAAVRGRVDEAVDLSMRALDLDPADRGMRQLGHEVVADVPVLDQEVLVLLAGGEPAALPLGGDAEAEAEARRLREQAEAEATQAKAQAETQAYEERVKAADALEGHPALLRLAELETLRELAKNANARLYLGLDRDRFSLNGSESQ